MSAGEGVGCGDVEVSIYGGEKSRLKREGVMVESKRRRMESGVTTKRKWSNWDN